MINVTTPSKKEEEAFDTLDQDWFVRFRCVIYYVYKCWRLLLHHGDVVDDDVIVW